ncbi:MAG: phosphatase PAP2 family protein [Fluviicola sp.]|nr:phosphatase PAP2 family protein [Fluviicola sp.]
MRLAVLFLVLPFLTFGQSPIDSLATPKSKNKLLLQRSIIPVAFIGLGIAFNETQFEKDLQIDIRNKVGNTFEFRIDDFIQYAPIAEMYIADAFKVPARNHWFDQTKYLIFSNLLSGGITLAFKNILNKTRPNGSDYSMPSGHTNLAFTNASVLFNEFNETAPVLAYSGYAFATTTGVFRMINNKHWLSDVLVGAGIGILATEIIYRFEPLKNWNPFKKTKDVTLLPRWSDGEVGVYFRLRL